MMIMYGAIVDNVIKGKCSGFFVNKKKPLESFMYEYLIDNRQLPIDLKDPSYTSKRWVYESLSDVPIFKEIEDNIPHDNKEIYEFDHEPPLIFNIICEDSQKRLNVIILEDHLNTYEIKESLEKLHIPK
ncbi:hypothetical protein HZS_3932 [Henneguya salminicola]|nr:hypothetical protein HZS_3932 [Henneguya salminicola]